MSRAIRKARRGGAWFADLTRTQLWPVPTLGIVLALALAVTLTELDARVDQQLPPSFVTWIFGGDADAARSILGSMASSLITVTSLTFSLTVVTLQLASSQFSPRLLRTFTRDRFVQVTLALFLGTFAYALTVLRTVRTGSDGEPDFIPRISITSAYLLTIASVIGLVLFLAHLAEEIRVETMLRTVHADAAETVRRTLADAHTSAAFPFPARPGHRLLAERSGFLTNVRGEVLVEAARKADALVLVERATGSSLIKGIPTGVAWSRGSADALSVEQQRHLQDAFDRAVVIGFERTSVDDISYGLRQLTDVAAKALSPGINDPTTATHALGHSAALVCQLAGLPLGDELLTDSDQTVRAVIRRPDFAELLELAVDQPRRYGAGEPQVMGRLFALLREVAWVTDDPGHHQAIRSELDRLRGTVDEADTDEIEAARYVRLGDEVEAALRGEWLSGMSGAQSFRMPTSAPWKLSRRAAVRPETPVGRRSPAARHAFAAAHHDLTFSTRIRAESTGRFRLPIFHTPGPRDAGSCSLLPPVPASTVG